MKVTANKSLSQDLISDQINILNIVHGKLHEMVDNINNGFSFIALVKILLN